MSRIEKTIVVDAPIDAVYGQWTQFEQFPRFMEGVRQVAQIDDRTLAWEAEIGGRRKRWTARITDQTPDERIAWMAVDGARNDGAVTFRPVGGGRTEVRLVVDADPEGIVEGFGDRLGVLDRRIAADLGRFQQYIQDRRTPTGYWPGEIHGDAVTPGTSVNHAMPSTAALHHPDPSSRAPRGHSGR